MISSKQQLVGATVLPIALAVTGCGTQRSSDQTDRTQRTTGQGTDSLLDWLYPAQPDMGITLTPVESRIIAKAESDLAMLAKRSLIATKYLGLYHQYAVKAHVNPSGQVYTTESSRGPVWFAVAARPGWQEPTDGASVAGATFNTGNRLMVLRDINFSPRINAIFLVHELVHAEDALLNGEPDSPPLSPSWLQGELHAHAVVFDLLNEITDHHWEQSVQAADQRRALIKRQAGMRPSAFAFGTDSTDIIAIRKLFPRASDLEVGFLVPQFEIDTNMMSVIAVAGNDQALAGRGAMSLVEEYYRRNVPRELVTTQ